MTLGNQHNDRWWEFHGWKEGQEGVGPPSPVQGEVCVTDTWPSVNPRANKLLFTPPRPMPDERATLSSTRGLVVGHEVVTKKVTSNWGIGL